MYLNVEREGKLIGCALTPCEAFEANSSRSGFTYVAPNDGRHILLSCDLRSMGDEVIEVDPFRCSSCPEHTPQS